MYIINIVYSDGLMSGREVLPIIDADMYDAIDKAYEHYKEDWKYADEYESIDKTMTPELTLKEFSDKMKKGFYEEDEFAYIQCDDYHIQYEPTKWR